MDVLEVIDHHLIDERRVGASVADERVKVFPPTGLYRATPRVCYGRPME